MYIDSVEFKYQLEGLLHVVSLDLAALCYEDVLYTIFSPDNEVFIKRKPWGLITVIKPYLTDEYQRSRPEMISCCEQVLEHIAYQTNISEAKYHFLALLQEASNDTFFKVALLPLGALINRSVSKKDVLTDHVVHIINFYMKTIPLPSNSSLDIVDATFVTRVIGIYDSLLLFYKPLVEEVVLTIYPSEQHKNLRHLVASQLIQLLEGPLKYLDLSFSSEPKTLTRVCLERILFYLRQLLGETCVLPPYLSGIL